MHDCTFNKGMNIEGAVEINDAEMNNALLCGFNSMVLEILEKKNNRNTKGVTKIHCVKYI